jgi:hypothetical protein
MIMHIPGMANVRICRRQGAPRSQRPLQSHRQRFRGNARTFRGPSFGLDGLALIVAFAMS